MKKLLFCALFSWAATAAQAQFTLTPSGLVNETGKEFVIYDHAGKSQAELYASVHMYLNSLFVSPKDVLSLVENNSISINGVTNDIFRPKSINDLTPTFTMNYTITLYFKDGKIRVDNPSINHMYVTDQPAKEYYGVFTSKGKLKHEKTKASIEKFFNDFIANINQAVTDNKATDW